MAFVDEAAWQQADWKWDAHNLTAAPAEPKPAKGKAGTKSPAAAEDGKQGCQVDGCGNEVGGMKDYHSRYKICEYHLKAQVVQKDGQAHRFCQQCGKFQPLGDFDGEKRSCRARLDKHNARRRRQREMAHMLKKTGTIDNRLLQEKYGLTEEEILPKVARITKSGFAKPARSGSAATAAKSASPGGSQQPGEAGATATSGHAAAAAASYIAQLDAAVQAQAHVHVQEQAAAQAQASLLLKHLQAQDAAAAAAAGVPSQLLDTRASSSHLPRPGAATLAAAAGDVGMGALLLDDEFLEEVFNPIMAQGLMAQQAQAAAQPQQAAAFLRMDASSAMELDDLAGLEQLTKELMAAARPPPPPAPRAPLVGGPGATWPAPPLGPQPLPAVSLTNVPATPSSSDTVMAALPPYLAQPGFPSLLAGAPPFGGGLQPPPPLPGAMRLDLLGGGVDSPGSVRSTGTAMDLGVPPALAGSVLDEALNLLSYDSAQITYVPEDKLVRFSAKLFNCTPAQLPADLKASLVNMLSCQSMEGYLRPGCVHLTVNALMGPEERALLATSGVRAVVERMVARQPGTFWSQHAMLIQLGDKLALVREGRVVHVLATGSSSLFPRVAALRPLAAQPDADGCVEVAVWGHNLSNAEDVVLARCKGAYADVERLSLESDPAWRGLQKLNLRLSGLPAGGALQLEVMRGGYMSGSKAMLLTADRALAAEVRALEAEEGATDVDTLLFQLAASEELKAGSTDREYSAADLAVIGKGSRRLVSFAVQRKWVAATRTLLASAAADKPAGEAMAEVDIMSAGTTCMPLLQLAVRSQSLALVRALLEWGDANGYVFKSTTPGRRGLTALHLAGLVRDGGAIAALLSEKCADALAGWEGAPAEDGSLPIDFALRTGTAAVLERFLATKRYEAARADHAAPLAAPADHLDEEAADGGPPPGLRHRKSLVSDSASSSCSTSKVLAGEPGRHLEEEDAVATAKAALRARRAQEREQSALLHFRDPALEARYHAWSSAGQVPVDIAFLIIATLSQGAWIFRWCMAASWLGVGMVALMAVNAAMMQVAVLFPPVYVRCREALCVWNHATHKLAQTAVTLLPPVGTIFSPAYNPTVALLESSSLAQIHMLSFGMKLRFSTHLRVGLLHFGLAATANDAVCSAGFPFLPGTACNVLMALWQALACFALPCALVYASEKRSRRIFLETVLSD